ncbi:MAG: ATP-dependent Clp protease ATP-binding subunit [Thermoflexales bacterium]|nr:ATP-dependent Clp protease ATP-binding subunit [Thermoflexales bacterium]
MDNLNPKLLSKDMSGVLNAARKQMRSLNKRMLTPELILLALIRDRQGVACRLLERLAGERAFKLADLEREAESAARTREGYDASFVFVADDNSQVRLSSETTKALDDALTIAQAADEVWIGPAHLLSALCQAGLSTAGLLQRYGVTPRAMADLLSDRSLIPSQTTQNWSAQASQGQLTPVYYRQELLNQLMNMLSQTARRHVILVGEPGSGRRTLVYSLSLLIAEGKGPVGLKAVVEIAEQALLDNPVEAVRAGLRQAGSNGGGILFVPNIHRFFGGPIKVEFSRADKELQKAFFDEDVVVIGSTSETEYNERLHSNPAVVERGQILRVPPATAEETTLILDVLRPHFEADYAIQITGGALSTASVLAARYLAGQALPGAAVHLLHRACALVRMGTQTDLAFRPEVPSDASLDSDDVLLACSQMTGVPVTKLGADERTRYARMVEHLQERIIGQDEAVMVVSRAVKAARVGLKDPKRPIGSFLFLGPTGVGKTELARALAEFLFDSEDAMIALDMSEYQQEDSLNRLIGAAPGYVGYEGGGQLTERVRQQPYSIVLFDECEKAHPRILDVLLQIMEEGRLTDGQGRVSRFSEAVIILTSNQGAQFLAVPSLDQAARDLAMESVRSHFRPEFLNRLDEIVMFNALSSDSMAKILGLQLKKESKLAEGRGLVLELSEDAREFLLDQNTHPEWGARPLRRIIQKHIREALADFLLAKDPQPGTLIRIDVDDDAKALTFKPVAPRKKGTRSGSRE